MTDEVTSVEDAVEILKKERGLEHVASSIERIHHDKGEQVQAAKIYLDISAPRDVLREGEIVREDVKERRLFGKLVLVMGSDGKMEYAAFMTRYPAKGTDIPPEIQLSNRYLGIQCVDGAYIRTDKISESFFSVDGSSHNKQSDNPATDILLKVKEYRPLHQD